MPQTYPCTGESPSSQERTDGTGTGKNKRGDKRLISQIVSYTPIRGRKLNNQNELPLNGFVDIPRDDGNFTFSEKNWELRR